jgi:hypothetical protein
MQPGEDPRRRGAVGRQLTAASAWGGGGRLASATPVASAVLLAALFPEGIPPEEDLIRSVNRWLDGAERIAKAT